MAVLTRKNPTPVESPTAKTEQVVVSDPEYRGDVVDTRYTPLKNILTHVAGSSWIVKYYQQVLNNDAEPSPQDLAKDPVYQQYREISELELKVTSSLSQTQDEETKIFEVTGEATLYPPLVPNMGDMFLADVGDGREAIFAVTETNRLTILKDTAYTITYTMVSFTTPERLDDFARKVIERTHFVKKLLEYGEDPVVVNEDYHRYLSLEVYSDKLTGQYFAEFYNRSINSLSVPDQQLITYDPFMVKAIKTFMENSQHPRLRDMVVYSAVLPGRDDPLTIWDALMRMSTDIIPMASNKLALLDASYFGTIPQFQSVYFSNVKDVVYPIDQADVGVDFADFGASKASTRDIRYQFATTRLGSLGDLSAPKTDLEGIDALAPIHPVTFDDYYIFTESFYFDVKESQSQLETLVKDALEGRKINQRVLSDLAIASTRWGKLEKFYYVPVILILIKMARRGM